MHRALIPAVLSAALAGCAPNNATLVEGEYIAFLSDGTSLSLAKEKVDPADYDVNYNVDCRCELARRQCIDGGESPNECDRQNESCLAVQLDDALEICGPNVWPPQYEEWGIQAGYRVVTETMEPWRGQAIITSEGDLQIAFHHHPPGGSDMRFVIAVDPDFGPTTCKQREDGSGVDRVPLDGDWVAEWSKELDWMQGLDEEQGRPYEVFQDLEGGKLFFLNAYSYQLNPVDPDGQVWDMPATWVSGAAQGRFVEEDLFHRTSRYGEPSVYNLIEVEGSASATGTLYVGIDPADLWYCNLSEEAEPGDMSCDRGSYATMELLDDHVREVTDGVRQEFERMTSVTKDGEFYVYDREADPVFSFAPVPHTNLWRPRDIYPPGLDGWAEMHYNYVAFSRDSLLEVGGSAKGSFALTLDSGSSSTRVFIQGRFEIDKIKRDHWTTDNLALEKQIEAGVELCSAASEEEANPSGK